MAEVRKRLAQYYQGDIQAGELHLISARVLCSVFASDVIT